MRFSEAFLSCFFAIWWAHGVAVASGFWITVGCVILPPMAFVVSMMELIK